MKLIKEILSIIGWFLSNPIGEKVCKYKRIGGEDK